MVDFMMANHWWDFIYLMETNKANQWLVALSEITVAVWFKDSQSPVCKIPGAKHETKCTIFHGYVWLPKGSKGSYLPKRHCFFQVNDFAQMKELLVVGSFVWGLGAAFFLFCTLTE